MARGGFISLRAHNIKRIIYGNCWWNNIQQIGSYHIASISALCGGHRISVFKLSIIMLMHEHQPLTNQILACRIRFRPRLILISAGHMFSSRISARFLYRKLTACRLSVYGMCHISQHARRRAYYSYRNSRFLDHQKWKCDCRPGDNTSSVVSCRLLTTIKLEPQVFHYVEVIRARKCKWQKDIYFYLIRYWNKVSTSWL